jgi:flagellar hook-associated protein 3 FlgL
MSITGVGARSSLTAQSFVEMRRQLDDLQRQLGTGKKADSYAGLGADRGMVIGLHSQISLLDSFDSAVTNVKVRVDLSQTILKRFGDISHDTKALAQQTYQLGSGGKTSPQNAATLQLNEMLALLNTRAGDRYLFSGRATDKAATDTADHILNGNGAASGFNQVVAERRQADLGTAGLGRLVIGASANVATLSEDVAGSPFGFKLTGATSALTNAAVSGPTGSPAAISVTFAAGGPVPGETIDFALRLPDGSTETVRLTATASATPGAGEFCIGSTPSLTAANLQSALSAGLGKLAQTSLTAASAIAAADDFFNIDAGNPPRRVAGPPFATAAVLTAGTPNNTVSWYTGEMAADSARGSAAARIDSAIGVQYGLRANEEALRGMVQNLAAFSTMTFSASDVNAEARYTALTQRLVPAFAGQAGTQRIEEIQTDLAITQTTLQAAKDRHRETRTVIQGLLDVTEGVPPEQVGAQILALQTRLQASLQTASRLYQLSLANYL